MFKPYDATRKPDATETCNDQSWGLTSQAPHDDVYATPVALKTRESMCSRSSIYNAVLHFLHPASMSRFSHAGLDWTGGRVSYVSPAQTEASRAAPSPTARTARTNEQINPLAAYSRSLLDFHQKLWNDTRRNSELQARVSRTEALPEFVC
jgi:hypothetical protein